VKKVALACLLLAACEDPLAPAQRLDEPRVLGVRVTADDGSATPEPGSAAQFEVLIAGPDGVVDARFGYELCEPEDSQRGVPFCASRAFAEGTATADAPVSFDVPAGAESLLLRGVACVAGEPALSADPRDWDCSGRGTPLGVSFTTHTGTERRTNRNPDLSALRIAIDGDPVAIEETSTDPSCTEGVSEVSRGERHAFEIVVGARARESEGGATETLQLSHFASDGLYERQWSFVDPGTSPRSRLAWEAPATRVPVKHYLVVRDDRGGMSWASFSLCVR
jgi:hypothetical protein